MLPYVHLTERQRGLLECYGASTEQESSGKHYVFWTDFMTETLDESDLEGFIEDGLLDADQLKQGKVPLTLHQLLREILLNPENQEVEALDIAGCYRCDKLRPGEFGGFAIKITRQEYASVSTPMLELRKGKIIARPVTIHRF